MLACNCLNIIITTESNDFEKVNLESLNLNESEKMDSFFKQNIQQVGNLLNINKAHSGLVQARNVGSWTVYYCVNCDVHSHALHKEKGASCVLISSKLLASDSISSLKSCDLYSAAFHIIINPNHLSLEDNKLINTYLSKEAEATEKNFRQTMADYLRRETEASEERIRKFTEDQYQLLQNLRDKAYKEQQTILHVLHSVENLKKPNSTNNTMTLPGSPGVNTRLNEPLLSSKLDINLNSAKNTRHSPKRQKSSPGVQTANSFDAEGLFEFDGYEEANSSAATSEMEESDNEELLKEEGIAIPRNRSASINLAKSLPMNIPVFMSPHHGNEDLDDDLLPQENDVDIAASIKALAKSVHGNTVFGDLPKPRLSTQI